MDPVANKEKRFAKFQEAAYKYIERVFGALWCMWHIISTLAQFELVKTMKMVIKLLTHYTTWWLSSACSRRLQRRSSMKGS